MLPPGLVEETLTTLAILFPFRPNETASSWIRASTIASEPSYDASLNTVCRLSLRPNQRELKSFHHWHDRLVVLKRALDDSSAKHRLTHLSHVHRNPMQWYVNLFIKLSLLVAMCLYQLHSWSTYPWSTFQGSSLSGSPINQDVFAFEFKEPPSVALQIRGIIWAAILIVVTIPNGYSLLRSLFLLGRYVLQKVRDLFWWAVEMVTMTALYVLEYLSSQTVSKAISGDSVHSDLSADVRYDI